MSKILLCISAGEATVGACTRGKLRAVQRFDASNAGLHALREWVATQRGRSAWITVDTPDEEYRVETLPHVPARQRTEMLARKLQQLYRGTRYHAGRAVRSVRGKRREDVCLLAAYSDERVVLPWVEALQGAGLLIAGIHPIPLLLVESLRRARVGADALLLLMRWSGGIRQTVIVDRIPVLTRVTSIGDESVASTIAAEEVRHTRDYLSASGILPSDRTLTVYVLDPVLHFASDPSGPPIRPAPLPAVLARRISSAPSQAPPGTRLQLNLLARCRSSMNLAPAALSAPIRRQKFLRAAIAGSLSVGVCCAAAAASYAVDAARAVNQRMRLTASLQKSPAGATTPSRPVDAFAAQLDHALREMDAEDATAHAAHRVFRAVSHGLDADSRITLESLRWEQLPRQPGTGAGTLVLVAVARTSLALGDEDSNAVPRVMQGFAAAVASAADVERAQLSSIPQGFDASGTLRGKIPPTRSIDTKLEFETTIEFRSRHADE